MLYPPLIMTGKLFRYIGPSANKDSYCWGQDIPNNIFKSIEYIRLSSCIFKIKGPEENMLKISWQSGVRPVVINSRGLQKLRKPLVFV